MTVPLPLPLVTHAAHEAMASHPGYNQRSGERGVLLVMIAIVAMKLWLVARQEIIVQPHDDWWFLTAADALYWGRDYRVNVFMKLPVYPLFVWVVSQFGIPLRLVTEAGLGLAAASFAFALIRLGVPRALALTAMALAMFNPVTVGAFNLAVADNLYAILILAAFAQFLHLAVSVGAEAKVRALAFGALFAAAWCTRPESQVLALTLAVIGAVIALIGWREGWGRRRILRRLGLTVLIPALAAGAAHAGVAALNWKAYGSFLVLEYKAPQFRRAFDALQAVESGAPVRYVSVTAAQRRAAYAVSPTLATLEPLLEGPMAAPLRAETERATGVKGEVGSGWFMWLLRSAANHAGHHTSLAASEGFYGRIAEEIESAFASGALERRRLLVEFVDPNYGLWLPSLPHSLWRLVTSLVAADAQYLMRDDRAAQHVRPLFERMTARRGTRDGYGDTVRGWVFRACAEVTALAAIDAAGQEVHDREIRIVRPDVKPPAGSPCVNQGVGYTFTAPTGTLSSARIRIDFADGERVLTPVIATQRLGTVLPLKTVGGRDALLAIELADFPVPEGPARRLVFSLMPEIQTLGLAGLLLAVAMAWVRFWPYYSLTWLLALPLLVFFMGRLLIFAVIDASAWPGNQPRYIVPLSVLLPFMLATLWPTSRPGDRVLP